MRTKYIAAASSFAALALGVLLIGTPASAATCGAIASGGAVNVSVGTADCEDFTGTNGTFVYRPDASSFAGINGATIVNTSGDGGFDDALVVTGSSFVGGDAYGINIVSGTLTGRGNGAALLLDTPGAISSLSLVGSTLTAGSGGTAIDIAAAGPFSSLSVSLSTIIGDIHVASGASTQLTLSAGNDLSQATITNEGTLALVLGSGPADTFDASIVTGPVTSLHVAAGSDWTLTHSAVFDGTPIEVAGTLTTTFGTRSSGTVIDSTALGGPGHLIANQDTADGSIAGAVQNGGTLTKDGSFALSLTGVIGETSDHELGNIEVLNGTLNLGNGDADSIAFGDLTIGSATLKINSSLAVNSSGAITFNGVLGAMNSTNAGSTPFTYSGPITVTDPLATITLNGAHVISGDITVVRSGPFSAGRLDIHKVGSAPLTLSSNISGGGTFVVFGSGGSDAITLSGDISVGAPGSIGLGLSGATFDLTGDNSGLQGNLIVENGTLNIDHVSEVGSAVLVTDEASGTLNFSGGLTLTNDLQGVGALNVDSGTVTLTGHIAGFFVAGALVKTGNGTLVVSDVADARISVLGGTLELDGAVAASPDVSVASGTTLDIMGDQTFGALSDAGLVTNNGAADATLTTGSNSTFSGVIQNGSKNIALDVANGTLILTGANTYTGGTTIGASGVLQMGDGTTAGSIASAGNIIDDGTFRLANGALTISGAISGGGTVDVAGGTLTLHSANTVAAVVMSGGSLRLENDGALGSGDLTVSNSGVLDLADGITIANAIQIDPNATLTVNVDGAGSVARLAAAFPPVTGGVFGDGTTKLVKTGAGTLQADFIGVDGEVDVDAGTLQATGGDFTWDANALWKVDGTVDLNGSEQFIGPLSGSGTITNTGSADAHLDVTYFGGAAADSTFAGVIRDGATHTTSLEVDSGMLTLTGDNTYTGGTHVCDCAMLQLGDGTTRGSIVGDVDLGGELRFNEPGTYTFGGAIDINGGIVRVVNGEITLSGNITNSTDDGTIVVDGGSLTLSGDNSGFINDDTSFPPAFPHAEVDLNAGTTLHLTRDESLGSADVFINDATVDIANNATLGSNFLILAGTTATFDVESGIAHLAADCCTGGILTDGFLAGVPSTFDPSTLVKVGTGTLVVDYLNVAGYDDVLGDFVSGTVTVSAGTLVLNGDGAAAAPADYTVAAGATLDNEGINGLASLSGAGTVTNAGSGPAFLEVDLIYAPNASTFDGVIEDGAQPGGMSLGVDDGRLILRNANTYTGITLIGASSCGCGAVALQLGDGTTAGSIASSGVGIFVGELDFNEPSPTTFAGDIDMTSDGAIRVTAGDITLSGDLTSHLTGDGAVFIDGGSLTLTGDNSGFSGAYTVAGTLRLENLGSGTITTVGTVLAYNNGDVVPNTIIISSNTTQFSIDSGTAEQQGDIFEDSVSRPMEKIGLGTLIVDSLNITGKTIVSGGTFRLGAANGLSNNSVLSVGAAGTVDLNGFSKASPGIAGLEGSGTVTNAAGGPVTLAINYANSGFGTPPAPITGSTFAGAITDTPGNLLTLEVDNGTLVLTGASTYGGGTVICDCATLQLGDGGDTGSIRGDIANNNVLIIDHGNGAAAPFVMDNLIADGLGRAGLVRLTGPGTTVLTSAASSYSGGTELFDGTLRVTSGSDPVTHVGPVGTGPVTFTGNGIFQAGADNLRFDNAFAVGTAGGAVDTNGYDLTLAGAITDAGADPGVLTKTGAGTLTLQGALGYHGETVIDGGTLRLMSSNTGSLFRVNSGATLTGTGTAGLVVVSNGGTLSPGDNGIGTFHVSDTLQFGSGSTYLVELDDSAADLTQAGGAVTLGGTLGLNFAPGAYTPTQYTIATGTSISGAFASIQSLGLPAGFKINVTHDATNVFLDLAYAPFVWGANPGTSSWFTNANWQAGLSPASAAAPQDVLFGATTRPTIDIGDSSQTSLQFASGAPAYTFSLAGGAFYLTGLGIVDNSANRPTFVMTSGVIQFSNSASAGDAIFTLHSGILVFGDNTTASTASFGGESGIINFSGNATAGGATFNRSGGILEFLDNSTAGTATITTSGGIVQFADNSTPGQAALVGNGGLFSFTGTGPAGDGKVTAGSIAGAGSFDLGADALTAGSNNTSTEVSGSISGAGSLIKVGTGTLTISGNANYTGGTTVNGGTLQIGNGGAGGVVAGNIVDNATLVFNRSVVASFGGVISGTGNVIKSGTGTTTLTAANTYTGTTTVNGGTLAVNGTNASSAVTVNNGGTLGGSGTVGSTTVASGGAIAPGNSIGTLTVAGNLTLQAGSTTMAEFSTSASDLINVTGAAGIAGTLNVSFAAGTYLPHLYTLITSTGALSGGFSSVTGTAPTGFAVTLATDAHNAFVNLIYKQFIWGSNPGTTAWFTDANWTNGLTPPAGQDVFFDATTKPSIDIAGAVSELSLQFTTATPSYTFNLSGAGSTLTLTGQGINDTVGNAPLFNVGNGTTMTFANSATAGDARITAQAGGQVIFTGTSSAGSAALTAQGSGVIDLSGTTGAANDHNLTAGSIAGSGSFVLGANHLTTGSNNASTEVSGVISGSNGLTKTGTGTLILSGTNTFPGGLVIANGTVQFGNGGTAGSVIGAIVDNGVLAFNRSDNLTAPVITGTGGVRQMGPGTLTLASAYAYTGATQVTGGTLSLTGSVTSAVTVSGGTLAGTGTMNSLAVASGGTVSPGVAGVGTLTVSGAASFATGSTYAFDATTGVSDRITTSGAINLGGGTVAVTVTPGSYAINSRITLVSTTASLSGGFASLTLNGSFGSNINPVFDYDATHAYLLLRPVAITTLLPPDAPQNVIDIAAAIDDAILNHNGGDTFAPLANLNQADLVKVLEQLSGEVSNGVPDGAFENLGSFLELLLDPANDNRNGGAGPALTFVAPSADRPSLSLAGPVSAASPVPAEGGSAVFTKGPVSLWGSLKGGWSNHGGDAVLGTHPTNVSNGLMAAGVDIRPEGQDLVLGAAIGLGQVWWTVHPGLGSGHSNAQQIGVYGSKRFGQFYVSMAGAFAQFQSTTLRTVVFGGANAYRAHVDGQGAGLRAEGGYRFEAEDGTGLTPYATFQAQSVTTSGYAEQTLLGNPAFALSFPHQSESDVSSELGLALDRVLSTANDNALSFEARAGWWHDYASGISRAGSLLAFPGTSFIVRGVSPPRDAAELMLGLDADIGDGLRLQAKAQSLLAGDVQEYGGNVALTMRW